jgi:hypothetical protein
MKKNSLKMTRNTLKSTKNNPQNEKITLNLKMKKQYLKNLHFRNQQLVRDLYI